MSNPMPGRLQSFFDEIDDWCGTGRHFPPRPKGLRDLLLANVINEASTRVSDQKIQAQLQSLANELHRVGAQTSMG